MTNIEVSHLLPLHLDSIIGIFTLLIFLGDKVKTYRKFEGRKAEKELIPDNLPGANKSMTVAKVAIGCWTSCHAEIPISLKWWMNWTLSSLRVIAS